MLHVHATPRAFVFIGRLAELTALAAASPPQALVFRADGGTASGSRPAPRLRPRPARQELPVDAPEVAPRQDLPVAL
jgi:hypothetical protein